MDEGDAAATEQLLPLVYDELRRLASRRMASEPSSHTLQPTALVHEAFVRLVDQPRQQVWRNRGHFFAAALPRPRRILIEAARRRGSLKRGGGQRPVALPEQLSASDDADWNLLLSLDEALERLQREDSDSYKLVMLRYFGGLSVDQAAEAMGISERTAQRYWSFARAWLQREIAGESGTHPNLTRPRKA